MEFPVEAREHLSNVEAGLLLLEREPDDAEVLNAVFRSFPAIKGLAAFLGASAIQELAHEAVIKSLGNTCRDIPAISGGSIPGDGRVGLIIDVNALRYQD